MNKGAKAVVMDDSISVGSSDVMTYNGTSTYAQSDDVVAKTAYDGTVSGNVTIANSRLQFINAGAGHINLSSDITCAGEFTLIWDSNYTGGATLTKMIFGHSTGTQKIGNVNNGKLFIRIIDGGSSSNTTTHPDGVTTFCLKRGADNKVDLYIGNNTYRLFSDAAQEGNFTLGRIGRDSATSYRDGSLGYVRLYSTALTDSQRTAELALGQKQTARKDCVLEILPDYFALPASPTTVYDSVGNNNGTITGAISFVDNGIYADGTTTAHIVDMPIGPINSAIANDGNFTFAAWVYVDSLPGGGTRGYNIISHTSSALKGRGLQLQSNADSTLFRFEIATRDNTTNTTAGTTTTLSLGQRYHVVGTVNYTTPLTQLWVDGVSVGTNTNTPRTLTTPTLSRMFGNGLILGSASPFNGKITGVSVYNRAITDSEVTEIYNAGRNVRTPVTSGLISEYRPSPTTIYDVKAFTPATPVIIKTTARRVGTAGTDDVIIAPYGKIQATSSQFNTFITQTTDKTSVYSITDELNHNIVCAFYFSNGSYNTKLFVDGVLRDSDTWSTGALTKLLDYIQISGGTNFFAGTISNTKVYIGKITDAEGVLMSSGIDITPVGATLFTAPKKMSDTTMIDTSPNDYDFTITP